MIGIYSIKCVLTGKIYIGSSVSIVRRWSQHKSDLRKKIHVNRILQNAWNKYKEECFEFSVIEQTEKSELEVREQYWMDHFRAYERGYGYNISETSKVLSGFNAKKWIVTRPDGEEIFVKNMCEFCRNEPGKLSTAAMNQVAYGRNNQHKNYKCRPYDMSKEKWEKTKKRHWKPSTGWGGRWLIIFPCGKEEEIDTLTPFCKKHNLSAGCLSQIAKGKARDHKGFKCYKINGPQIPEIPPKPEHKYKIIYPNQEYVIVDNLSKFCRDNNIKHQNLYEAMRKNRKYKGFRCYKANSSGIIEIPKIKIKDKYKITYPDQNTVVIVDNLAKFCRENNLDNSSFGKAIRKNKMHKGYKCVMLSAEQAIAAMI